MATLFIYTMSTQNQPDLFLSDQDGNVSLSNLRNILLQRSLPSDRGPISGEGFTEISDHESNGFAFIECYCTTESSLGYYYEALLDDDGLTSRRVQHTYYSKSKLVFTESNNLILKFDWTSEEKAKTRVKELIESFGPQMEVFKVTDQLIRVLQENYHWTAAKIDRIVKDGDNTKKVSYTIDPSDSNSRSVVDEEYRDHGNLYHLTFEMPFDHVARNPNTPSLINVKLYSDGHRIVINEDEFGSVSDIRNFQIHLMNELIRIKNESDGV
ncbi:hypothetical protein GMA19_03052 [Paenibacillus polymyxa E681]|uniref:hypothetical protein n=2 Tax=Paenibacillus polymyxa TaxID=1406 RepID=UPI0001E31CB8|nr:hypothetical protein [Paenibacillus polymyxa]ADM70858.1 hypothetical protein PPE_03035 [Paenibacillus polymyxa E681]QNV57881.1 hypothetical protein GE561_03052 [Paenibacillus polymyxa E681]QNV62718.1 hypothetical protein GMA19_03052 [Paenibacillus polymyxa E681]